MTSYPERVTSALARVRAFYINLGSSVWHVSRANVPRLKLAAEREIRAARDLDLGGHPMLDMLMISTHVTDVLIQLAQIIADV